MNFKRRIQLFVTFLILLVSTILTVSFLYHEDKIATEKALTSSQNIKSVYDSIRKDLEDFYIHRAYANLRSYGIKEAMVNRDKEKLYALTLPRYKTLREENPHLLIMQFHAPDGHSILRMHRQEAFGDNIAARRPMVKLTHKTHMLHAGFEGGIEGIAYRIIVPVVENNVYIGAIEFGVDPDYIINKLVRTTKMDTLFMLHESRMAAADTQKYEEGYSGYRFAHLNPFQRPLIEEFVKENPALNQRIIHHNGKDYDVIPIYLVGKNGKPIGLFLSFNDVTMGYQEKLQIILQSVMVTLIIILLLIGIIEYAFTRMTKKITYQDKYISTILNSQKNITIVMDDGKIVYVNNAFFDYFQYRTVEEFTQAHRCICELFETTESENYLRPQMDGMMWSEYVLGHKGVEHKVKITRNGKISTFTVDIQIMEYDNVFRQVVVLSDITNLNNLATVDMLTQVTNRSEFDKMLKYSISVANRYGRAFSILIVDIDHFKLINDNFGHLVGDEALKSFSSLLRQQIRLSDIVARWGGEEFIILLPDTPLPSAITMAEALRQRIEVNPFETVGQLTCSIGVAEFDTIEEADDLLRRADENLYRAKHSGRNRVVA
ncbi:diguanylate cyclase [Sulfuricurvum sp.]|uniref:diguanylate cyclase n=1 Tax=Sulfuricurvum sp. TaxID=2025608 RepID=UPI0025D5148B|nr:diguanylate cyclase [Sulfuricurvum sp.]